MKTKILLVLASLCAFAAHSQPTIVSTVPTNMATVVSPTAQIVFTFSEPMNPSATAAQFMDAYAFPPAFLATSPAWSSGNTILSCTPIQPLPANKMIAWIVDGENPAGDPLDGDAVGVFTTSGSSGADCTNEIGSLTLGKGALYAQTSAGTAVLEVSTPFAFVACSTIACSNRTTTNLALSVPGGAVLNVPPTPIPGHDSFTGVAASLPVLDSTYTNGNYVFTFQSPSGGWPCTVNFPANLTMPNAPHLTNFAAAQVVNPAQPFVLAWDAFQGGTADDSIYVEIYGGAFQSSPVGSPGVLTGTARSVTIPAGTLQPNQTYGGAITFYDIVLGTNSCGYVTVVYRAATTEFTLRTIPSGLVSWWPGENSGEDVAGPNNATSFGNVGYAPGLGGQSFDLDGSSAYLQVPLPVNLPLGSQPRTLALWIKTPRDLAVNTESALVQYGTPANGQMFGLITSLNASGKLYFYGHNQDLSSITSLGRNVWQHAAVTYDGTTVTLYLNGQPSGSQALTLNTVLNPDGLTIGNRPGGWKWQGQLDEVMLFNRVLTANEIGSIYTSGTNRIVLPPTLAVTCTGGSVLFSWPASAEGFGLVSRSQLSPGAWDAVTNEPSLNGIRKEVVLPANTPGQRFFRLSRPGP